MQVFRLRERLIGDYGTYVRSFIEVRDKRVRARVQEELDAGLLWLQPLMQLTPSFVLDTCDRMQRAIETGEPYQTLLDPPPADPRVAHSPRGNTPR